MPINQQPLVSIIVPTLNEEGCLEYLLASLRSQSMREFEILIVDGGSEDKTLQIADRHDAKVLVLPGTGEFASRNFGAQIAKGKWLVFTCADIVFPSGLLEKIVEKFKKEPELVALTGPGYPFDSSFIGKIEYALYNIVRYAFSRLPAPLRRFSTSTNFLVVESGNFKRTGGFRTGEINADGLMGKSLSKIGEVVFSFSTRVYLSSRRMKNMGFLAFNKHYLYVLENLFFFLSKSKIIEKLKLNSMVKHREMHEPIS